MEKKRVVVLSSLVVMVTVVMVIPALIALKFGTLSVLVWWLILAPFCYVISEVVSRHTAEPNTNDKSHLVISVVDVDHPERDTQVALDI